MGTTFRSRDPEQRLLLPPAVHEFVPPGHLACFVRDLAGEQLDLSAILDTYSEERGYPPYDPVMMTALQRGAWCSRYRLRKGTVEPVFGIIKHARRFRQFLLRGLRQVQGERGLGVCSAYNLRLLAKATA